jgi:hypothetical protein
MMSFKLELLTKWVVATKASGFEASKANSLASLMLRYRPL